MENFVITISREFGSGGRKIGEEVAKKLGINFFDKAIIDEAAMKSGLSPDFIEKEEQTFSNSILFNLATSGGQFGVGGTSLVDKIYISESKAIKEFAEQGSCVIVGRCADFIMRDKNSFNVFIYADDSFKHKRIVEEYGYPEKEASKLIKSRDKTRARHYNYYCDRLWGDRKNYHIMINSSAYGIDNTVDLIVESVKKHFCL